MSVQESVIHEGDATEDRVDGTLVALGGGNAHLDQGDDHEDRVDGNLVAPGDTDPLYQLNLDDKGSLHSRQRKKTAKGVEYQRALWLENRRRLCQRVERKGHAVTRLLALGSVTAIEETLAQFDETVRLFQDAHTRYSQYVPLDRKTEDEDWYDKIDEQIFNTKHQAVNVLRELRQKEDTTSKHSHIPSKSFRSKSIRSSSSKSSHSSKRSHHSSHTGCSSNLSVEQQLLKEHLLQAELRTEEAFHEEKYRSSFDAADLKRRQEIAKSAARMKVLQSIEHHKIENRPVEPLRPLIEDFKKKAPSNQPHGHPIKKKPIDPPTLKTLKTDPDELSEPKPGHPTGIPTDHHINETLCKMIKHQLAPEVDIEPFDGNPLNFNYFTLMFKEVVETKIEDQQGRLTRLLKYTSGEAKETIKHCIQHNENGYDNAMKLLHKRYGDPHLILSLYRKKIRDWPLVKFSDPKGFREFLTFIVKCDSFVTNDWNILDTPETISTLVSKFPPTLVDRWNRKVMFFRHEKHKEPKLAAFIEFVERETILVNDPLYSREAILHSSSRDRPPGKKGHKHLKALATKTEPSDTKQIPKKDKFICCNKSYHDLEDCPEFTKKDVQERSKFVGQQKLCYGCYLPISPDHNARSCNQRKVCKICSKRHPTSLHGFRFRPKEPDSIVDVENSTSCYSISQGQVISMCVVPVRVRHQSSNTTFETLAMLDSCSQATFVTKNLIEKLGISGRKTPLCLKSINGTEKIDSTVIKGLVISSAAKTDVNLSEIQLPKTYTQDELPVDPEEIATKEKIKRWKYLQPIFDSVIQNEDITNVGLLIGADCLKAIEPIDVIKSQNGGPYAYKTILGWCVVGPIDQPSTNQLKCNRIAVRDAAKESTASHHFEVTNTVQEDEVKEMLQRLYFTDFVELNKTSSISKEEEEVLSVDEKQFITKMDTNVQQENGHYFLPLPFKKLPLLPNNRRVAEKRLNFLKRKFTRDDQFFMAYKAFMNKLLKEGHAEKSSTSPPEGKT